MRGIGSRIAAAARAWWEEDGRAVKERRVSPGEDPLLAVRIPPGRSYFAFGVITVLLLILVGRAFWLQCGINTEFLQRQGEARVARMQSVPAVRGQIVDRNGIVLASTIPARAVWAVPAETRAATPEQWKSLAKLLGMKEKDIKKRIEARQDKSFVYIHRQVDVSVAENIKKLGIPGIYSFGETRRQYPDGRVSAQIVGFTNIEETGQDGVELIKNKTLAGENGRRRVVKDRMGRVVEEAWMSEPVDGSDVVLSIDSRIQYLAFQCVERAVEYHKAKAGAAVVVDPASGEILALVNIPTYDPNNRKTVSPDRMRNRAYTDMFEPGSTMKPFAVAKALDKGIVSAASKVETSPGRIEMGKWTIRDTHNYGLLTVGQVIAKSSNIGTLKLALRMDSKELHRMYSDLGFGSRPKDFPGAVAGRLRKAPWKPLEQATISYGHGVAVSLVQLAQAYTALARSGDRIPVTIYKTTSEPEAVQVYKPRTAYQVRGMMMGVVEAGGTARQAKVPGYSVAGKTGTAHKNEKGRYLKRYVADFVGMAPATDPKVIVAVMLDEPTAHGYFGGSVAGPVFAEIMEGALRILHVAPDRPDTLGDMVFSAPLGKAKSGAVLTGGKAKNRDF